MRKKTKKILTFGLVVLAVLGVVNLFKLKQADENGLVKINPVFSIGTIVDGEYAESTESFYTKEKFACDGLEVSIDLEYDSKFELGYEVFYYTHDDIYITSSGVLYGSVDLEVHEAASYARMVVTPIQYNLEKEEDREIKWYQIAKFTKPLTIKVNEKQTLGNKFEVQAVNAIYETFFDDDESVIYITSNVKGYGISKEIKFEDPTRVKSLTIKYKGGQPIDNDLRDFFFYDEHGLMITAEYDEYLIGKSYEFVLDMPYVHDTIYFSMNYVLDCEVEIYINYHETAFNGLH